MKRLALALGTGVVLAACKPPAAPEPPVSPTPTPMAAPTATPTPTVAPTPTPTPPPPTPEPTPLVPRKPMEIGKMFNGITFKTRFLTPESDQLASVERVDDDAYQVEIAFTAKLPRPSTTLEDLASNDPKLPHVLNRMTDLVAGAEVSPFFEQLYKNKITTIREDLFALNEVLSRHNFYDCETILQMADPATGRKALLVVGDMDVNVDGSDGDRNVEVDDSGRFFQPQTSYRWRKTTDRVNPFLPKAQARLAELKAELAAPATTAARKRDLQAAIDHTTRTISDLKSASFLVSASDPTIVVPTFMLRSDSPYAPGIGDYGVVIYDGVVYPVIVGDAGPSAKVGEASVRLCRQINPKASALSRAVSSIKVAYLIFPGTAEKPGPPDLDHWRAMCQKYLDEIGGAAPELFAWENIVPPWPTPTPTPTPEPTATPAASPDGLIDPAATPVAPAVVTPPASPEPSAAPAATPAVITP